MFLHNSFARASFSVQSFKMAQQDQTARSGYWRLFYTEMQEKALAQRDAKKSGVAEKPVAQVRFIEEAPTRKSSTKRKPVVEYDIAPKTLKPLYRTPVSEAPKSYYQLICQIRQEFKILSATTPKVVSVVEDDDEQECEILLLAA